MSYIACLSRSFASDCVLCLSLALPYAVRTTCLQRPGSSSSGSRPSSADWHEWEINVCSCNVSHWDFGVITAGKLTKTTKAPYFQSALWKYNWVLSCQFSWILALVSLGWLLANYLDHTIGEFQLISRDFSVCRLKGSLLGNCIRLGLQDNWSCHSKAQGPNWLRNTCYRTEPHLDLFRKQVPRACKSGESFGISLWLCVASSVVLYLNLQSRKHVHEDRHLIEPLCFEHYSLNYLYFSMARYWAFYK